MWEKYTKARFSVELYFVTVLVRHPCGSPWCRLNAVNFSKCCPWYPMGNLCAAVSQQGFDYAHPHTARLAPVKFISVSGQCLVTGKSAKEGHSFRKICVFMRAPICLPVGPQMSPRQPPDASPRELTCGLPPSAKWMSTWLHHIFGWMKCHHWLSVSYKLISAIDGDGITEDVMISLLNGPADRQCLCPDAYCRASCRW